MIAVDAEDGRFEPLQRRLHHCVTLVKAEVGSNIAEDHDGIVSR